MIKSDRPATGNYDERQLNIMHMQAATREGTGYGVVSRELVGGLALAGANVMYSFAERWDWRLYVGTPVAWLVGMNGRFMDGVAEDLLVHTMFDADLLPPSWVHVLNRAGLIWVPSAFCERVFRDSGVERPIIVEGYGIDPEVFAYVERGWLAGEQAASQNGEYTFLTQCGVWGDRKNALAVMRAFAKLNLPKSKLIVKMRSGSGFITEDTKTNRNVVFRVGDMPVEEWAGLMGLCDCFVSVSSGEGFSLVPLEAMATGLPTIVQSWGGPLDYIDDGRTALGVRPRAFVWAEQYNAVFGSEARWAEPDFDHLCERMKWCYENRDAAAELGKRAAAAVLERWTWSAATRRAYAALKAYKGGLR